MDTMEDDIIVHPRRGVREKTIPACGVLLVNPTEARTAIQTLIDRGGDQRFLFHSGLVVSPEQDFFVAGPALGAPMAAMVLEKLIVLGANSVVMAGWCGAVDSDLSVGDTVLGGVAHPGEGTSRYYSNDDVCEPSSRLLENLQTSFNMIAPVPVWSTDAPYRESRKMLKALAGQYHVSVVDMEYSALCAVAAFRGIDFASLFLVSDELWQTDWHPGFNGKVFKRKSKAQIKQLMQHIVALSAFEEA
ncbi:MAG: nucleoside phosphorylase [Thermodesulfobacteriota bacterium]|nr:nucleoside phosphorylase [Thermodesulfobacteriota bacterium]